MRCTNCRKELMLGSAYCDRCGWSALGAPPPDDVTVAPSRPARPARSPGRVQHKRKAPKKGELPTGCGIAIVVAIIATIGGLVVGVIAVVGAIADSVSDDDAADVGPPTSSVVAAGTLEPGQDVQGEVDEDQEAEYDLVGVGGTVEITVSAAGDFDPTVTVFGLDDAQIGYDDDGAPDPSPNYDSRLRVELDGGITYRVVVAGFGGDGGEYVVGVRSLVEPRELLGTGVPVPGVVGEDEVARYPLDAAAGREATITVAASGGFDPTLTVRGPDGRRLGYDDDGGDAALDSRLTLTVPPGAVADVAGLHGRPGTYAITVACGGAPC